jgi:hypothetical protein
MPLGGLWVVWGPVLLFVSALLVIQSLPADQLQR